MNTPSFKYGNGVWATKEGSSLAYNDDNGHYKPLPFSVSRASSATRVNKQGLIEVVGNDRLRIDYSESTKGVALLEPSRTNNFTYSEAFDNASWSKDNANILANDATAPDGNVTADKIIPIADGAVYFYKNTTVVSGQDYSCSIFVKADGFSFFQITGSTGFSGNLTQNYDLNNGLTQGDFGSDAFIEDYGNGWYRCGVKQTATSSTSGRFIFAVVDSINAARLDSVTKNSDNGVFIFGSQIEAGSYATSYIPTSGSTATRQADVANGAGVANVFNDSEGVLFADISFSGIESNRAISISDGTTSNRVMFFLDTSSNLIGYVFSGGSTQSSITISNYSYSKNSKLAMKYKANDFALWVDGFEIGTDASGVTFGSGVLSQLDFDGNGASDKFYGKAKAINVYQTALTDAELEYLTSYRSLAEMVTELNLNAL